MEVYFTLLIEKYGAKKEFRKCNLKEMGCKGILKCRLP
jgi:hypothetical protein